MRSVLVTRDLLAAMVQGVPGIQFDMERMRAALSPDLFATAHALEQVRNGVPFRDAYRNAAKDLDQLKVPEADAALRAYTVDGYPGRLRPDLVREQLRGAARWTGMDN